MRERERERRERERERESMCVHLHVCVCGEKGAREMTQQVSEESQVQEKSKLADAAAGERLASANCMPKVEEEDGQLEFSIDVTFPAKA